MKADEVKRLEAAVRSANPVPHASDLIDTDDAAAVTLLVERRRRAVTTTTSRPTSQSVQPLQRSPAWAFAAGVVLTVLVGSAALLLLQGDATLAADEPATETNTGDDATGTELLTLQGRSSRESAVEWSPDGTHVATVIDGTVNIWDALTGGLLEQQHLDHLSDVSSVVWSPDGVHLAVDAEIYDPFTGDLLLGEIVDPVLAFSPDGTRIVAGGAWGAAGVIDVANGDQLVTLPLSPSWVYAAAWSPDGTRIATTWGKALAAQVPHVKVWDATTGDELLDLVTRVKATDVAWSPDGSRIATASLGMSIAEVWDATTGEKLFELTGHTDGVWAVEWNPDGTRIATASEDGTAKLWDAITGDELANLTGHVGGVTDVAWSPDGTRVATASHDDTIKIWRVG